MECSEPLPRNDQWIVVTTIQPPTAAMRELIDRCQATWSIVVVGDVTTPDEWASAGVHYLSIERQRALFGPVAERLPLRHYARKNLGYLFAAAHGATCILETDDDNRPVGEFGERPSSELRGRRVRADSWLNAYAWFTDETIWPRGLPLDAIRDRGELVEVASADCPIQQFLVDGDPDVDAVFRLVLARDDITFAADAAPVILEPGTFCPFNSQNTVFFEEAFETLYLPAFVSFRMTDIWRSFVAQAALWAHGGRVAFRSPTAHQDRNPHDLMRDLADEVPGMVDNRRIAERLTDELEEAVDGDLGATCGRLWRALAEEGVVREKEHELYEAWLGALRESRARVAC